ncbi:carboxypeptidase regulatory-like domain-containing protein [Pyxidicoccus parkwayensis]|uniref:Carboxypeptidase regulatory-like domain-containing protein n=1 Tax=Pyxidicoccus parkwayensis TaxID=2813578 RepID=A0ABX7P2P1_9BACT|nr:carboxypeptidase-like regulatory domain-containing protein [Pyxidicoccus parkwaysis]QSQ24683.1 carboxypeptidase regulatory-like domain-containing protein [Pyxidicoccus parkwaysis]
MRSTFHIAMAVVLAWGVGACGNITNDPFRVGTVRGQLTEFDSAVALVSLVGHPGVRSNVDAQGRFALEGVPAGPAELFIVATAEKAVRVNVTVQGGQSVEVKSVAPRAAGFFDMKVKASQGERLTGAQVSVEGTPFQRLLLDNSGQLRVGPLPDGCYEVTVSATGFPVTQAEACVGPGEKKELKLTLEADPEYVNRGCAVTGCADGLVCAPTNNKCVECYADAQCGAGFSCRGFRCEGEGPQCTACNGNWQCAPSTSCQDLPEGGTACLAKCGNGQGQEEEESGCDAGFTCQAGRCLPDAARFQGCGALLGLGMACDGDTRCQAQGLTDGRCVDGACTVPCTSERECPGSLRCLDSVAGRVCRAMH